jgi:hypothetical protein
MPRRKPMPGGAGASSGQITHSPCYAGTISWHPHALSWLVKPAGSELRVNAMYGLPLSAFLVGSGLVVATLSCGRPPPPSTPAETRNDIPAQVAPSDDGNEADLPALPPQLASRRVQDPGYAPGPAGAWKVCMLDSMRAHHLRCGKELLWESESLPSYRVSAGCRALATSVGATCKGSVEKAIGDALPSPEDVVRCRDRLQEDACDRIVQRLRSPLFANGAGVGCSVCGRQAVNFAFGANRPEPVPALDSLPFAQSELDAIYDRVDAGLGAVATRRCVRAKEPHDCFDLSELVRVHAAHPDAMTWKQTILAMQPRLDELTWVRIDQGRCIRQSGDQDERECSALRNYVEFFPVGQHVVEARAILARSAPPRDARVRAAEIDDCRRACASPPRDWGMGPGPAHCAQILGQPCK